MSQLDHNSFILNNRGGRKLVYMHYMYTFKKQSATTETWVCSKKASANCKGQLIFKKADMTVSSVSQHSHESSQEDVNITLAKVDLKRKIKSSPSASSNKQAVISETMEKLTAEERVKFGNMSSVKRSVRRVAAENRPQDPPTLQELRITSPWSETVDKKNFLIDDNLINDRIIIFGSNACLDHLANSSTWMMDGTFSVAPTLFKQLYVIRAPLDKSAVSMKK